MATADEVVGRCALYTAVLVEATAFELLETLFGLFETYLAAIAVAHLPAKTGKLLSRGSPSVQLDKFVALAVKTLPKASGLKDVKGAVTGAESLVFCSKALFSAVSYIT